MVTIRLARHGGKKRPFYHLTVAEKSAKRDGRFIERIGFYNPLARGKDEKLRIDMARLDHWLGVGAQPTDRVRQLAKQWRQQPPAPELGEAEEPSAGEREGLAPRMEEPSAGEREGLAPRMKEPAGGALEGAVREEAAPGTEDSSGGAESEQDAV